MDTTLLWGRVLRDSFHTCVRRKPGYSTTSSAGSSSGFPGLEVGDWQEAAAPPRVRGAAWSEPLRTLPSSHLFSRLPLPLRCYIFLEWFPLRLANYCFHFHLTLNQSLLSVFDQNEGSAGVSLYRGSKDGSQIVPPKDLMRVLQLIFFLWMHLKKNFFLSWSWFIVLC